MKNYAILRDAVEEKVFGLVIEQDGGYRFYGADDRAREWATWANSTSLKSLQEALPVGVTINDRRPLVNDTELFIESLIESASNSGEMKKSTFSYKGSHVAGVESSTPSARDFQLRSFDISARKNAINFKVFAFKNDQKSSSLMAKIRSTGLGFNEKTGEFRSNDITISNLSLQQNIENTYAKSLQRNIGFNIMAAKNIYAKSLAPFYTHPNVVELKRLGGAIGPKLGRGLRSAPMGMVFVDVTGAIDADKDGIVFEGKPGLERPIIPKFILPEGVGRRVASLIGGAAEQNEKNRRSGIVGGGAIDEVKLRSILGTDASSLNNLNASSPLNDGDNADADGMRSIAGNIRSRRDAIIAKRRGSTNLSRVGTGEKTQLNTGDSRAVEKMTWDDSAKELIVTFAGGRTYTYNNVDDSWVDELEKNPDALGRIMNDIKKAGYDFTPGGTHAPDKTLASRMQGRREAAGMRSRVTAGEIGVLDSDRYKSKRTPPPLTDREKEIVDLVDAPRKFELEDRESLQIQIANHVAKTRDAIYDAILTGDINENEASEFLDEMSVNLIKPLNAVYGTEPKWGSSNEADEFLDDFVKDAEKRFKRAAETYSSVRKLRKNSGNNDYGDIAIYITPLNEYLDGKDMDGHSLLGSYPSGQLKLESIIDNYVIDEIDGLIDSGKDALDANHEEAYEEFANSMREMIGNLNPEDYPSGLAEYVDKALEEQKEWFFDSINTLVNENANARADAVMRGIGMSSTKKPSNNDFDTSSFLPSLSDREDYIASDEYEADLEDWLTRFPRKTEADFRRSKTFMENVTTFNPGPDVSGFSRNGDPYDGWSREEIESGIPDTLWRGMGSRTSNLTPEGKRDINDATKKLSDFSRSSSFGDVYPGAEKFDSNNRMHQSIYDEFEDADMPPQRVQDVLNAMQALKEVFGEDSDVGMDDRMRYALDHIAPSFDSRLRLSQGARSGESFRGMSSLKKPGRESQFIPQPFKDPNPFGEKPDRESQIIREPFKDPNPFGEKPDGSDFQYMGSRSGAVRPAGFTQRSRTAMLERTAIGSPTGMRSARKSALYKVHEVSPGQEKASTNDGKLWATLSPADKQLFAERARARESELIDMLFDRFGIPVNGTDRRLDDETLTPKERAKILKQTGGGQPWVVPNPDAPGHYLLVPGGLRPLFTGVYGVQKKAKELAQEAREHLAKGEMKEHKAKVAQITTLLRLSDDLETLAAARLQGDADDSLIDKNDSYDLAIDHLHPVSRARIMDVGATTTTKGKNSAPVEKRNPFSKSGSNRPFEFNFSKAQMDTPSTAINVPGRPLRENDDILRSAGVAGDDVKIKKASRLGGFLEFMRARALDTDKADQRARERRIKKMRAAGINVGSVEIGERPSLLDKRAMKISRIARKKLLNAKARKMDALEKSAADNNDATAIIASTESGATMLTPGGIVALSKDLKVGEKEWRKAYNSKGRNGSGHSLAFVWDAAGMNGTPNPVNEEEFKELLAAGWKPIKRGTGSRGYGISYFDNPKRHLPRQGEAYGPGEYWSVGTSANWSGSEYYPEPNGELGDGPGGIVGLLPPTAKIMTSSELDTIRDQHRAFSSPILGNFSGYTEGELEKTPQQDFVEQLVSDVFGKIPRDSAVWDSAIGQMTLQLISALESNPSPEEYKKLRNALFRLTTLVNQDKNVYGPIFGADALDMGNEVVLVMNRAAVSVFADPLPIAEIKSMSRGEGLSPGYVVPGRK